MRDLDKGKRGRLDSSVPPEAGQESPDLVSLMAGPAQDREEEERQAELKRSARELRGGEGWLFFATAIQVLRHHAYLALADARNEREMSLAQGRLRAAGDLRSLVDLWTRKEEEKTDE
jgi:hypothetical protein